MDRRWLVVTGALIGALGIALSLVDRRPSTTADGAAGANTAIAKESSRGAHDDVGPRQSDTARDAPPAAPTRVVDVSATPTVRPPASDSRPPVAKKPPDRRGSDEIVSATRLLNEWMASPPPVEDDEMLPFRSAQTLHRELDTQGRDPDWSESAEAQLRAYLTFMAKGGWIDIASIRCGESMCEIQAATRSADALAEDNEDWNGIMMSMPQQPWWSTYGFDDPNFSSKSMPDGRMMYVAFVRRKTG